MRTVLRAIEYVPVVCGFFLLFHNQTIPAFVAFALYVPVNQLMRYLEGIEELIVATGARVEYLPPYSPDFNPIEMLWSTVKSLVRMFPTRAMSAREQLIELALMLIGTNTFKNWFTKCCYCTN
ncbi:MAG: transposase [Hormoscilla sp. GM102CHS1]|nr:transposase [Hormoscilla sp. GM102CHS1]